MGVNHWIAGLGLATLAGAGLAGLFRLAVRQPQAPLDGVVTLDGLKIDVEVIRDPEGVPHIYGATDHDVHFALGYVHAQDRLWHMELNRRLGQGRLAEIFGEPALGFDRFMRRLGLSHVATAEAIAMGPEERAVVNAYVDGVNAYLSTHRWRLPLECRILNFRPSPWEAADVLAVGKLLCWLLSANWDSEWFRSQMVERLGPEGAAALEPGYPTGQPLAVPPGMSYTGLGMPLLAEFQEVQRSLHLVGSGMSNAWAVSPERSATGAALLASDPHLRPQMPSIWYEAHLCGAGLNVVGATMPGVPVVLIGHNERIAWGITASMVDTQDLFVERVQGDGSTRYLTPDGWEPLTTRIEQIRVRGRDEPIVETIQETRHGPALSPLLPGEARFLTVQSTILRAQDTVRGAIRLNRASNWEEFRAALADLGVALNFIYADRDGNIGYQLSGQVPRRKKGTGLLPVPGWDPNYDWDGYLTAEELPSAFNPRCGYVVSANNRIPDVAYPHVLSHDWIDGFRAMRIEKQLLSRERHTVDEFAAMQMDVYSEPAQQLVALYADVEPSDPFEVRALEHLRRWDYRLTAESIAATIFVELKRRLLQNVFGPRLGPLAGCYVGSSTPSGIAGSAYPARVTGFLLDLLRRADPAWLHPQEVDQRSPFQSWTELKQASLSQAVLELRAMLGDDMDLWHWGRLHTVSFDHPLGQIKPLDRLFCRGPYPIGGDGDTPCQTALGAGSYRATEWVPSYRQIVDLGNFANSRSIHTTGQSGHPGSPHFDDFIPLWREGHYHPMRFDRREILDCLAHMLVLRPA